MQPDRPSETIDVLERALKEDRSFLDDPWRLGGYLADYLANQQCEGEIYILIEAQKLGVVASLRAWARWHLAPVARERLARKLSEHRSTDIHSARWAIAVWTSVVTGKADIHWGECPSCRGSITIYEAACGTCGLAPGQPAPSSTTAAPTTPPASAQAGSRRRKTLMGAVGVAVAVAAAAAILGVALYTNREAVPPSFTWYASAGESARGLSAVAMRDQQHGCAVGEEGLIRTTADGGASWATRPSSTGQSLRGVWLADGGTCWAVGDHGTVVRSSDSGKTWRVQSPVTAADLADVAFRDAAQGWVVGGEGTILRTQDGGKHWAAGRRTHRSLLCVCVAGDADIWVGGAQGLLLHSEDSGRSWREQPIATAGNVVDACFVDADRGWLVARSGDGTQAEILATDDGGSTWRRQYGSVREVLAAIVFADASTGWVVGHDAGGDAGGVVLATADGGRSWHARGPMGVGPLAAVTCVGATTVWVTGKDGRVFDGTAAEE